MNIVLKVSLVVLMMVLFLTGFCLAAGAPKIMSYQGRATDASDDPVADGLHTVAFDVYNHPTVGTRLWGEVTTVTTTDGLFTHLLGSVTPIPESYFHTYDGLYLQVTFEGQVQLPRTQFTSAGYAFHVQSIHNAEGGNIRGYLAIFDAFADGEIAGIYGDANGEPILWMDGAERSMQFTTGVSGSASVVLPSDAIEASEIKDEPGVASTRGAYPGYVPLSNTIDDICTRSIVAPTEGHVLVIGTALLGIGHTNGTTSSVNFGVSDNISSFALGCSLQVSIDASAPSGTYKFPVVSHALFAASAGSQTFYFLASEVGSTYGRLENVQLTECFFGTAYGTVVSPMSAITTDSNINPERERLESMAANQARLESELIRMKAQFEALKKEIKSRIPEPQSDDKR